MANDDVTYKFNKINKVFVTFCAMALVPSGNCNDKTIWTKMQSNLCMQAIIMINIHIFSYVQVSHVTKSLKRKIVHTLYP